MGLKFFDTSAKENINVRVSDSLGLEFFETSVKDNIIDRVSENWA